MIKCLLQVEARRKTTNSEIQVNQAQSHQTNQSQQNHTKVNFAGKSSELNYTNKSISFIADSSATEHLTNKGFLLKNFVKSTEGVIKTANKSKKANIKIDGKGNLYLNNSENKTIKLSNIIAAHNTSDNLLSLRKCAEVWYGVYRDDTELNLFNRETNENLITGVYQ